MTSKVVCLLVSGVVGVGSGVGNDASFIHLANVTSRGMMMLLVVKCNVGLKLKLKLKLGPWVRWPKAALAPFSVSAVSAVSPPQVPAVVQPK